MLCSKCYQKIPKGEEIQIKGSIVCEKCASNDLESIGGCNYCLKLIYKDEMIHEVYEKWGTESSEKLITCHSCYKKWLKIAKLKRSIWEATKWLENFFPLVTWFVLFLVAFDKEKMGWMPVLLTAWLIIVSTLISPLTFALIRKIIEIKYRKKKRK
ncbi:Conserved protein of unknown function (Zinc finger, LIM-type) [endosymbiont DhMRE of Dentiscutata heterogama]|uniref:hypothetical protein n=1 Tax=endosymbiont DhMRE of Dentiscutata heterogama TaxID=1609546 RepID=UPI000629D873|nr:hypothetical protein [endosymbiont DhMRE of Dentiscutata heterogama]CFW92746.1 Conserved protein of unknown function (Zinc finger, LIM-type) [endosymbiont DhMRE of Dentiscutata heterogama]